MSEYCYIHPFTLNRCEEAYVVIRKSGLPQDIANIVMEWVTMPIVLFAWIETYKLNSLRRQTLPLRTLAWISSEDRSWSHLWHGGHTGPVHLERCQIACAKTPKMLDYTVCEES